MLSTIQARVVVKKPALSINVTATLAVPGPRVRRKLLALVLHLVH